MNFKNLFCFLLGWNVFAYLIDHAVESKHGAMLAFGCAMVIWSSISDSLFSK